MTDTPITLFPLNTVLFPGMPLNLHIFEERYKLMINTCIETRQPFGVVLIANSVSDINPRAEPYDVGCTAQITQVQPLGGGQMNITAVGKERFQILSLHHDKPYLVATAQAYPFTDASPAKARRAGAKLRVMVDRYLSNLAKAGQLQFNATQLPNDPLSVGYLSAVLLPNVPVEKKQELLTIEHTSAFLDELFDIYRKETALLDTLLNPPEDIDFEGMFSLN